MKKYQNFCLKLPVLDGEMFNVFQFGCFRNEFGDFLIVTKRVDRNRSKVEKCHSKWFGDFLSVTKIVERNWISFSIYKW